MAEALVQKTLILLCSIILMYACSKNEQLSMERYYGVVENNNGDILSSDQLRLTRSDGTVLFNEFIFDTINIAKDGSYDVLIPNSDKVIYSISAIDTNVELFIENTQFETIQDSRSLRKNIEIENVNNFRFCRRREFIIDIKKIDGNYKELDILMTKNFEESSLVGTFIDYVKVLNIDTVITKEFCRINDFELSYFVTDGENTLSHNVKKYEIDQNNPLLVSIEY